MMKLSNLQSFSIYELFGTTDVQIPFKQDIKILIGENGIGKTQVLNMLYYTLTQNFFKLNEFKFTRLVLSFQSGVKICLNKTDIEPLFYPKLFEHSIYKKIIEAVGYIPLKQLLERAFKRNTPKSIIEQDPIYKKIAEIAPVDFVMHEFVVMHDLFEEGQRSKRRKKHKKYSLTPDLKKCTKKISAELKGLEILYFPTFRRVEEDLHNLGYEEERLKFNENDERLIHFGMSDVTKRLVTIENKIDALLKEGFSKISSEILSQLVKGFSETNRDILHRIDETDIEIILSRVGNEIPKKDKEKIRDIVVQKEIAEDVQQLSLLYFLQKLIEIYEKQRPLDDAVKTFRNICNRYLINKKVFYDESAIKIFIKSNITGEHIPLSKLSSGEKQIISIFSKIYLSNDDQRFMVLFDEPELSLSMPWQKQLLPDIVNSKKCDFLLAVTHSPFIFDNELDQYAVGLNEYIKIAQNIVS